MEEISQGGGYKDGEQCKKEKHGLRMRQRFFVTGECCPKESVPEPHISSWN